MAREPHKKAVRLKDLAEHLGLSIATISLVLNRSPVADSIPPETHERVFAAARKLGYRPNFLAQSLRSRKTDTIGVVVPAVAGASSEILEGIEHGLRDAGLYHLLTSYESDPGRIPEAFERLERRQIDGFVVLAADAEPNSELPMVVVSQHPSHGDRTSVTVDQQHGAQLVVRHLKELGHKRIALFEEPANNTLAGIRRRAIDEAAAELGIEVAPGPSADEPVRARTTQWLASHHGASAVVALRDQTAIDAIQSFVEAGLGVPEEISVVGFGDLEAATYPRPRLTTVKPPLRALGERAARILVEGLEHGVNMPSDVLQPELVVRDSTGPIAPRDPKSSV